MKNLNFFKHNSTRHMMLQLSSLLFIIIPIRAMSIKLGIYVVVRKGGYLDFFCIILNRILIALPEHKTHLFVSGYTHNYTGQCMLTRKNNKTVLCGKSSATVAMNH